MQGECLNDRNWFSHSSGIAKFKIKFLARSVSGEHSLLTLQTATFSKCPYKAGDGEERGRGDRGRKRKRKGEISFFSYKAIVLQD